jgi:nitroimidazol reductase NimA-like FMN-containing flavoprotein (pyridoxamine 5'-phosphate oxidase superfamily)
VAAGQRELATVSGERTREDGNGAEQDPAAPGSAGSDSAVSDPATADHAAPDPAASDPAAPRRRVELGRADALDLLASVPIGRIVFTRHALPAIRPVNHIVDREDIIIRTHEGAALSAAAEQDGPAGVVVAYEADSIDPETRLGWSVVVTGYARLITDPAQAAEYQRLLRPWADQDVDYTVRIRPDLVTGYRLVHAPSD